MKRFGNSLVLAAVASLGALLAVQSEARAGFTISLESTSTTGALTTYSYSAAIAPEDEIKSGDFFRIYDFNGYQPGSIAAPAGWTATVANSNNTPPPSVLLNHGDDSSIPNLIFTYNGAATIFGSLTPSIPGFTAVTNHTPSDVKDFVGQLTKATGPTAGSLIGSVGDIVVPSGTLAVPEPASLVSCGLGIVLLGGMGYSARSRRKLAV